MNEATREYIRIHGHEDVRQLALRGTKDPEVDLNEALQQIAGRQTAHKKLPSWADRENMIYPPHLSMEQCSSEQTARYKAKIISKESGLSGETFGTHHSLVDLTGGFGVDFSFLAPLFEQAVYVERQEHLCAIARQNFKTLGLKAEVICEDGEDYLHRMTHVSFIYLDPARRDDQGARTYGISDCTPDVLSVLDELLEKADYVLLKLSPMLDWQKTVSDLGAENVRQIHIVSVKNECKELLVLLSKHGEGLHIFCTNDNVVLSYDYGTRATPHPIDPYMDATHCQKDSYLYEPNASIMKAGCFMEICKRFDISQLAQSSHLFVSDRLIESFPGRKFRILAVSTMNKKELKEKILPLKRANITVRNFPLSVAELRKRFKLNEGGSHYLFATTLAQGEHILLVCEQLF